jgi:hypothetical protein
MSVCEDRRSGYSVMNNLERFKTIDEAYNARDWNAYSALLDEGFRGWIQGKVISEGKAEHVNAAKQFCAISADNRVHNAPYTVALQDRDWSCTIARFTGTLTGVLRTEQGKTAEPNREAFDTTLAVIARWVDGRIVEEYEFLDASGILQKIEEKK